MLRQENWVKSHTQNLQGLSRVAHCVTFIWTPLYLHWKTFGPPPCSVSYILSVYTLKVEYQHQVFGQHWVDSLLSELNNWCWGGGVPLTEAGFVLVFRVSSALWAFYSTCHDAVIQPPRSNENSQCCKVHYSKCSRIDKQHARFDGLFFCGAYHWQKGKLMTPLESGTGVRGGL